MTSHLTAYTGCVQGALLLGLAWVLVSVVVGPLLGRWVHRRLREQALGLRCVHGDFVGDCARCRR